MTFRPAFLGVCVSIGLLQSVPLHAQAPEPAQEPAGGRPVWVNIGLGADFSGDLLGFASSLNLITSRGHLVTVRATYLEEFDLCIFGCLGEPDSRIEGGVLYGVAHATRWVGVSAAAGLGVIGGRTYVYDSERIREDRFTTVGIPLEAQLYFRPFRSFGLGATGIVNVNGKDTLTGIVLGLQIGRLAERTVLLSR